VRSRRQSVGMAIRPQHSSSRNKLALVVVAGAMALAGQLGQAEIDRPLPPSINCAARNEDIIREVRSDPRIIDVLRRQHEDLNGSCGTAVEIAQTVAPVAHVRSRSRRHGLHTGRG
jgi:hypothetical protein